MKKIARAEKKLLGIKKRAADEASGKPPRKPREAKMNHPAYGELVLRGVYDLNDKTGSSVLAVAKWIKERYPVSESKYKAAAAAALKKSAADGFVMKIKNSFKLAPREQRARDVQAGVDFSKRKDGQPAKMDDLVLEAKLLEEQKIRPPESLTREPALTLAPADCAGDCLAVAEFADRFDRSVLGAPARGAPEDARDRIRLADLEAALAALPDPRGWRTPPLLQRLCLALLRVACGRDAATGAPTDDVARRRAERSNVGSGFARSRQEDDTRIRCKHQPLPVLAILGRADASPAKSRRRRGLPTRRFLR